MRNAHSFLFRLAVVASLLCGGQVAAHQQKESYTTLLANERSGKLEVSHRFYIHDAEHALSHVESMNADLIGDEQAREEFAAYVRNGFVIKTDDGQVLDLELVGFEVEGKFFWVYQEADFPVSAKSFKVQMTALQEVWPRQVNHINVERAGKVHSVRLGSDSQWQELPFK